MIRNATTEELIRDSTREGSGEGECAQALNISVGDQVTYVELS